MPIILVSKKSACGHCGTIYTAPVLVEAPEARPG